MKHVFVSPHPDDTALSCGGLVALLRDRGESVAIVTVFSGPGPLPRLTPYQRLALGFGSRHRAEPELDQAAIAAEAAAVEVEAAFGPVVEPVAVPTPSEVMAARRAEDRAYADFAGAQIVFIDAPDAVFRDYREDGLMGPPRPDDPPPVDELRRALAALAPDRLYIPLSIGGHVDHRQARRAACEILSEPARPYRNASFYEDFPYALNTGFETEDQLDPDVMACLPPGARMTPEYVALEGTHDRKLKGLRCYESQLGRLFGGDDPMATDAERRAGRVGELGGIGPAERYWRIVWPTTTS